MDQVEARVAGPSRQELIELAVNESNTAIYITDSKANFIFVNKTFTAMLGYRPEDIMGRRAREIFGNKRHTEKDYQQIWADLRRGLPVQEEALTTDNFGREVWLTASMRAIFDASGELTHLIGRLEDTTESRQIQSLQRDVLAAIAEEVPLADVMNMLCGRVEAMFPEVVCSILAVDQQKRLRPLGSVSLPPAYNAALDGIAVGPDVGSCGAAAWRGEAVAVTDIETDPLWAPYKSLPLPLGLRACWSSPIKLRDGRVAGTFAFYFREKRGPGVSHEQVVRACLQLCIVALERHEAKERIANLAYFDSLTGLPNRAKLREEMIRRFDESEHPEGALIFLDIDHFKDVNDTLGHSVGDNFLVEIAKRLRSVVWDVDLICRHGGDEFVIVLDGANAPRAQAVAEILLQEVARPVVVDGVSLPASASIGIAVCPADGRDSATLLRNADTAMYSAKAEGRGSFRFFSTELNRKAQDRLLLGALFRDALENGQIQFYYQPQICARKGDLAGAEALARWRHPALGDIPPSRFIPLAEDSGLIEQLGEHCINEVCAQLKRWDEAGFDVPHVAVNVSPTQFRNPNLPSIVADALEENDLHASRLVIEVTESVMMDAYPAAIDNASALRTMGVAISMDDFGTGYSSLSHLARLPVSELKIDRSFMKDLEDNDAVRGLVTAVIRIGETLGLKVVAEGVETVAQRRFLEALGCDVLQGYLFGEAMAPLAFAQWLTARSARTSQPAPTVRLRAS